MLNRRKLLAVGGVAGGAMLLPNGATARPVGTSDEHRHHHGVHEGGARLTGTPFAVRMPVPPRLRPVWRTRDADLYEVDIHPAEVEILPGVRTPTFAYGGGQFIGPTIRARSGRRVQVTYRNSLDRPANVHLHGAHVPAGSDGHPMEIIEPGRTRLYDYPNTQQGATLWYHDHSHHTEAENVYHGLQGFYLIDDDDEDRLGLPSGNYDVPIALRDALFDANGSLVFFGPPFQRTTVLANGKPRPYFPVAARKYRFRLLNSATERVFQLTLGNSEEMIQIGSDGGLLPAPVSRTGLRLASAERVDLVIDFSRYPVGTQLVLSDATLGPVLRFDVVRQAPDFSRVPSRLRRLAALPPATAVREVNMSFDFSGVPLPVGLVNGLPYDPTRNDFTIKRGTTEIWNITSTDPVPVMHTFHLHLVQFRVLDRNGQPPTLDDAGRKDTITVAAGEVVRIQATFGDYLGEYVYHCHFLEHSSLGMMAQMKIVA